MIIASTPFTKLTWFDGEYVREFETGKPLKVNQVNLMSSATYEPLYEACSRRWSFSLTETSFAQTTNRGPVSLIVSVSGAHRPGGTNSTQSQQTSTAGKENRR